MNERGEGQRPDSLRQAAKEGAARLLLKRELAKFSTRIHGSGTSYGFVQIQDHARDIRPGGKFGWVSILWRGQKTDLQKRLCRLWVSPIFRGMPVQQRADSAHFIGSGGA